MCVSFTLLSFFLYASFTLAVRSPFSGTPQAHLPSKANGGINYGSATTLETDASPVKDFLLKFSVTSVNGQQVTGAKIRLYDVGASVKGGDFRRVANNTWQEGP